jgi:hypothetical protein
MSLQVLRKVGRRAQRPGRAVAQLNAAQQAVGLQSPYGHLHGRLVVYHEPDISYKVALMISVMVALHGLASIYVSLFVL